MEAYGFFFVDDSPCTGALHVGKRRGNLRRHVRNRRGGGRRQEGGVCVQAEIRVFVYSKHGDTHARLNIHACASSLRPSIPGKPLPNRDRRGGGEGAEVLAFESFHTIEPPEAHRKPPLVFHTPRAWSRDNQPPFAVNGQLCSPL